MARGVAFTTTVQASIDDPRFGASGYVNVFATPPGRPCPAGFDTEDLAPQFEVANNGVPGSIQGRNSLDAYGDWTVCANIAYGSSQNSDPKVYAVGTVSVTPQCTSAQASVTKAQAAVRAARRALRTARRGTARGRARARLAKRLRELKVAKQRYSARVASACPEA